MSESRIPTPGMRVGVFYSCTETTLALLGYGVYEGEEIPPEDILMPEVGPPALVGLALPKLRLDDGQVAWGCEIWWEREAYVKTLEEGRQIVKPKLESLRSHARKLWKEANAKLDTDEEALP